jgi:hypothetical protein
MDPDLSQQGVGIPLWLLAAGAIAVAMGFVFALILWRAFRPNRHGPLIGQEDLSIDIAALRPVGPPPNARRLEFYGKPVRVVVLVMAPLGRGTIMPSNEVISQALDDLVPGLMSMVNVHQPIFRRWPAQLSWHGFAQSFFANMRLPGDRKGKDTPWCSIAGKLEAGGQPILAGMVLCADEANTLSQVVAEHPGQWHDVLRVRRE